MKLSESLRNEFDEYTTNTIHVSSQIIHPSRHENLSYAF